MTTGGHASVILGALLVPLLSGFLLTLTIPDLRSRILRYSGYLRTLYVTFVSLVALLVGGVIYDSGHFSCGLTSDPPVGCSDLSTIEASLSTAWSILEPLRSALGASVPKRVLDSAFTGLLTSVIVGLLAFLAGLLPRMKKRAQRLLIKTDPLRLLLFDSLHNSHPLLISMRGGKAYLGWVKDPGAEGESLVFLPTASGYRDDETRELILTNDYRSVTKFAIESMSVLKKESAIVRGIGLSNRLLGRTGSEEIEVTFPNGTVKSLARDDLEQLINELGVTIPRDEIESVTRWHSLMKSPRKHANRIRERTAETQTGTKRRRTRRKARTKKKPAR